MMRTVPLGLEAVKPVRFEHQRIVCRRSLTSVVIGELVLTVSGWGFPEESGWDSGTWSALNIFADFYVQILERVDSFIQSHL